MKLISAFITLILICVSLVLYIPLLSRKAKRKKGPIVIGFFHPYCASGGGGEKVSWVAVYCLLSRVASSTHNLRVVIYTGDYDLSPEEIFEKVKVPYIIILIFNNFYLSLIYIYTIVHLTDTI